jgi:hypothetical protein
MAVQLSLDIAGLLGVSRRPRSSARSSSMWRSIVKVFVNIVVSCV